MGNNLLVGFSRYIVSIPPIIWKRQVARNAQDSAHHLGFMSETHHLVRNFVVREIPRAGRPLTPEFIAEALNLSVAQVSPVLDDLEKHLTFLFRNEQGAVAWAYPVTTDKTPHRVSLSTGEQTYAA